ncbi:MAG TPA: carboxypeptidase regulatory-like domain-containing protein, partial [Longimicrobium sp.]|nr:carboxypeptidase regulatory-like domain-containing protein [Longimicrobium sp.]
SGGGMDRLQLSAALPIRRGYLEAIYESNAFQEDDLLSVRLNAVAPLGLPRPLSGAPYSLRVAMAGAEPRQADGSVSFRLSRRSELSLAAAWNKGVGAPVLSIGLATRQPLARVQARVQSQADGTPQTSVFAEGAVAWGPGAGLQTLPNTGAGSGGVTGHVFRDLDGDGAFGPGDEPVPGAEVLVAGLRTAADERGEYALWEVPPYEITAVRVDTLKLGDPGWVPSRPEFLLRPTPHVFTRIDVALVRTRELAGGITSPAGDLPIGGITVELVEAATGEVRTVATFSDGEFYVSRIRPGEYDLRVSQRSLDALGARAEPASVRLVVPAEGDDPLVEAPPIRIYRNR